MPLALITGAANAGKSKKLYALLADAATTGSKATLVLPTREDVERARSVLANAVPAGVVIVTFPQLIEGLWDAHGDGRAIVRAEQRAALLGPLLAESLPSGLSDGPGLRTIICQLTSRAAEDPRALRADDSTAIDLASMVRALRVRLRSAGLVERPEAARRLVEMGVSIGGTVAVNRFTDLEEWQLELLFGLARLDDVAVSLTYDPAATATAVSATLERRLAERSASVERCCEAEDSDGDATIRGLATRLFSDEAALPASSSVAFAEASSAEGEAALAASFARAALDAGTPPERIAVAYRDVNMRRHHLQAAFIAEGVAAEIAYEMPLGASGLGRAMRALVTAASGGGVARDVSTFAGSPYAGQLRSIATSLDRRMRRGGVSDGAAGLKMLSGGAAAAAGLGDHAESLVKAARRCSRGLSSAQDARAWNKLAAMLVRNAADARGTGVSDPDNVADLRCLSAIGTLVAQVLETGATLASGDVLSAFDQTTVVFGGSDAGGTVKVVDVGSLRSRRFDMVVIGGLTAHDFAPTRSEPLIGALSRRLGLPSGSDSAAVERQLFYLAVSRARRRLVLTRQASNDRGEPIRPSAFWDEAMSRFGVAPDAERGPSITITSLGVDDVVFNSPAVSAGRRTLREGALEGCAPARPTRGMLGEESIAAIAQRKTVFSPTELETWLQCPYRWFYDRLVRPGSMDAEMDALVLGSLAHDLLHDFYADWTSEAPRRVTAVQLPEALARFDELAAKAAAGLTRSDSASLADQVAVSRAVAKVRRAIEADVELTTSYVPTAFEVPFGDDEPFRFGEVPVHGRIDRVDFGPAGALVIDYKSGGKHSNWASWSKNAVLQLPIYAAFASQKWDVPIAGAGYRSLSESCLMGFTVEKPAPAGFNGRAPIGDSQLDELMETARADAARAAAGIRAGDIERRPLNDDSCGYCGLAQVCGR